MRGKGLLKYKNCVNTVYFTNVEGSHKLLMKYIGEVSISMGFSTNQAALPFYTSQSSTWVDTECFKNWAAYWYSKTLARGAGP